MKIRDLKKTKKQPKWDPGAVLRALADEVWPVLARNFRPNCCVAATRICVDVLARFGVAAEALPTEPVVANDRFLAWERGGRQGLVPPGAWVIEVDLESTEGFPGHLVVAARSHGLGWVLDPTAPQFSRPARGILVEGAVLLGPARGPVEPVYFLPAGAMIAYRVHSDPGIAWEHTPDWAHPKPHHKVLHRELVEELAATVRSRVEDRS